MARETRIDEPFPAGGRCPVSEVDDVFPAPAEPRCADGGVLVGLAERREEGQDAGVCTAESVVVEEGDEEGYCAGEVVSGIFVSIEEDGREGREGEETVS